MSYAINIYVSNLNIINAWDKERLKGHISLLTLEPNTTMGFKPSDDEKELFYLIENSNVKLREFVWTFKDLYIKFFKERILNQKF